MPPAETAVSVLSHAVASVSANKFPVKTSVLEGMALALAEEMPFYQRALAANLWIIKPILGQVAELEPGLNAFVRTTTAPTMLSGSPKENVLPILATAVINHRIMPGESIESTRAFVIDAIDDSRVQLDIINESMEPSRVSSSTEGGFLIISKTIQQISRRDLVVVPGMLPAATDTRHYAQVADDSYRFIFIEIEMSENRFHGTNERIDIESYLDAIRFFVQLIKNSDEFQNEENVE